MSHTPTPWHLALIDDEEWEISVPAEPMGKYVIASDIGGRVHLDEDEPYREVDANARLLWAAPDLLAALEVLTDAIWNLDTYEGTPDEGAALEEHRAAFRAAREAIAKARGRNP